MRDPHDNDDTHYGGRAIEASPAETSPVDASPAETSPPFLDQPLQQALRESPTIALKLIRREAIEELRRDCLKKSGRVSPNKINNRLNESDEQNANNISGPQQPSTDPGNGGVGAAKRINRLAVEWFLRRNMGPLLSSSTVLADFSIVCQDDCVVSTRDATTRFVQSRVFVKVEETGCTVCKVINPQSIAPALATAGCKTRVVSQKKGRE